MGTISTLLVLPAAITDLIADLRFHKAEPIVLAVTLLSASLLLFLVMDPLGNIGFFIAALSDVPQERQKKVVSRELLIALLVLILFLFIGRYALWMMRISEPALSVSGGIILLLIALRMIFPSTEKSLREPIASEPFVVPLAIPYVAGPSAMAAELLLMSREPQRWPEWLLAVVFAWLATSIILFFSTGMRKLFRERGLIAIERLMGMILVTVAVQMLLTGITEFRTGFR